MESINSIIILTTSIYLMGGGLIIQTKNLFSALLFKVLPFLLGLGTLLSLGKLVGWW